MIASDRYVCSRIYLHDPPGEDDDLASAPLAPDAFKDHAARFKEEDPEVNQFVAMAAIAIAIGLLAATAEWVGGFLTGPEEKRVD